MRPAAIGNPPDGGPSEPSEKARAAAGGISVPDNLPVDLRRLVARRTAQVVDYQAARLAARPHLAADYGDAKVTYRFVDKEPCRHQSRRGRAYVQNHPLRGPYDAVNEVYFDDLADLGGAPCGSREPKPTRSYSPSPGSFL
jgi:hypothetical protein